MHNFLNIFLMLLVSCGSMLSCGSDEAADETQCAAGERFNAVTGECILRMNPAPPGDMAPSSTDAGDEADMRQPTDMSEESDVSQEPDLACTTDEDGDGSVTTACGGDDCDDTNPYISGTQAEICDEFDNDCDDEINEGIDCGFFAQSNTTLYYVEPFRKEIESLGDVPGLFDIDTHPDGTLYGITSTYLYEYDESTMEWTRFSNPLGNVGTANGMAIDVDGTVFITSGSTLYTADLTTGAATLVGTMTGFVSSGDCVVTKDSALLMTSSHTATDSLVLIDGRDGNASQVGQTGEDEIWGLTAAFNRLFGLTSSGRVVEINRNTGMTTLIHAYPDVSFYGAASTPGR